MQLAIKGLILSHNRASYCLSMYIFFGDGGPGPLETENNVTTVVKETIVGLNNKKCMAQELHQFLNMPDSDYNQQSGTIEAASSQIIKKKWIYLKPARQGQKILKNYFEHFLSIPPTSVEAKRAFSSLGLFANKIRNRLIPSSSALIPMSICTSQCLFSHSFTTYE
jgi:hypothetical protein